MRRGAIAGGAWKVALCLSIWLLAAHAESAGAEDLPAPASLQVSIDGQVVHPRSWTVNDLQTLPAVKVRVAYTTDAGLVESVYTGALLWTMIDRALPLDGPGKGAFLRHAFLVTGRDGYAVVISEGEIHPEFGAKQAIIAYALNGNPIPPEEGLKLILPDETNGSRAVRDVVNISVSSLGAQASKVQEPEDIHKRAPFAY